MCPVRKVPCVQIQKEVSTACATLDTSLGKSRLVEVTKSYARLLVTTIFSCADKDECECGLDDCDENANCTNTEGSYMCTCREGYCGDGRYCTGELCC